MNLPTNSWTVVRGAAVVLGIFAAGLAVGSLLNTPNLPEKPNSHGISTNFVPQKPAVPDCQPVNRPFEIKSGGFATACNYEFSVVIAYITSLGLIGITVDGNISRGVLPAVFSGKDGSPCSFSVDAIVQNTDPQAAIANFIC